MSEAQARFLANPDVMAQVAASQAAHKADPSTGIRSGIPKRRGTSDEKAAAPTTQATSDVAGPAGAVTA